MYIVIVIDHPIIPEHGIAEMSLVEDKFRKSLTKHLTITETLTTSNF